MIAQNQIDPRVVLHCSSHKLCKGCPIRCVAPVSDRDFDSWFMAQQEKIIKLVESA